MLSATAFACPQGTALTGGTGPNHKGGKCTAVEKTAKQHAQAPVKAAHPAEKHQAMAVQKDIKKAEQEKAKATAETKAAKNSMNKAKADMHPAQHDAKPAKS